MLTRPFTRGGLTRGLTRPLVRGLGRGNVVVIIISGDAYAGSTIIIDGGTAPYEYVINGNPTGVFTDDLIPLTVVEGDEVQVRDANGVLSNVLVATWEPDAADYFARAEALGGSFDIDGTYTELLVKTAWNDYILALKSDGTWNELDVIFPGCGVTFAGATAMLKHSGNPVATLINFVSGDYVAVGAAPGLKGNATNKQINSNWSPADTLTVPSGHHSMFTTEEATGVSQEGASSSTNPSFSGYFTLAGTIFSDMFSTDFGRISVASPTVGYLILNATASSNRIILNNGLLQAGGSPAGSNPATSSDFFFFSYGGGGFSDARRAIRTMGQGLTTGQETTLNNATQALMTALGYIP